jgi:hypothetical protein
MNSDDKAVPDSEPDENPDINTEIEYDGLLFGKFDKERFLNFSISGFISAIVGIYIIANTKNTPEHVLEFEVSKSIHFISDILPKAPKDLILFVLGNLLLLLGVYWLFRALKMVVRYIAGKTRGY